MATNHYRPSLLWKARFDSGPTIVIRAGSDTPANLAIAHSNRAYAYEEQGDLRRAIEDHSEAIRLNPVGGEGAIRMNQLQPPFNNLKARQALAHTVDQAEFMAAAYGDPEWWEQKGCYSWFVCGSPLGTEAGSEPYRKPDLAKATQLLKESGYDGKPLVILTVTDVPSQYGMAQVMAGNLTLFWFDAHTEKIKGKPRDYRRGLTYDDLDIGSYPAFRNGKPSVSLVLRGTDDARLAAASAELIATLTGMNGEAEEFVQ